MSVTGAGVLGCSDRKEEVHLPSHFAAYRTKRNSHSIDDCSSYDGDRPNSVRFVKNNLIYSVNWRVRRKCIKIMTDIKGYFCIIWKSN